MNKKLCSLFIVSIFIGGCFWQGQPHANVNVQSVSYLNPNILNQPSPVVVVIYQLKGPLAFQQTNLYSLFNDSAKVLGDDLIDKREIEIRPHQKFNLKVPLSDHTNYLGVIAAFRQPDETKWRQLIKVKPGKNVSLSIQLASQGISVTEN